MEPPLESPSPPPSPVSDNQADSEVGEGPLHHDTQPEKRKKKKAVPLTLTEQQEDDVVEWIRDNPILYSKGLKEYKDTARKQRLWEEKGRELNLESATVLMTWYNSMRTRLGKLTLNMDPRRPLFSGIPLYF